MRPAATSVLDVLTSDSEYSFLVELINIAGLTDLLQQLNQQSLTFFAPTNQVTGRSVSLRPLTHAPETGSRHRRYKFDARFRRQFLVPMLDF